MKQLSVALSIYFLSNLSLAQSSQSTSVVKLDQKKVKKEKILGLSADMSFNSNTEKTSSVDKNFYSDLILSASFSLPADFTIKKTVWLTKQLLDDRSQSITTGFLTVSKKFVEFKSGITLSGSIRQYLPYNQDDREDKGFNGSTYLSPSLKIPLGLIGLDRLSLTMAPRFQQYFYDYTTDNNGSVLADKKISQIYALSMEVTDKISLDLTFWNIHTWDSNGNRGPDKYLHEEALSFQATKGLSLYASHGLTERTFKANGKSSNISLSGREAEYSLGATYTY